MKKLLAILVSLLLAGPAFAQLSGRGLVDNAATGDLPTCTTGNVTGMRAYDTTLGYEVTCNGTAWVPSGGTGVLGDTTITDGTPSLGFNDTDVFGTRNPDGSLALECLTSADCDLTLSVNAGGTFYDSLVLEGNGVGSFWVDLGWPSTGAIFRVDQGGNASLRSNTPNISFWDNSETVSDNEASIGVQCATEGDCDMTFTVEADSVSEPAILIDSVGAGDWDVKLGDTDTNYVNISETGAVSFVGTAKPQYVSYFSTIDWNVDGAQCAVNAAVSLSGAAGGPHVLKTIDCADNDAGKINTLYAAPDNWDGGDIHVKIDLAYLGADPNGVFGGTVKAMCRGDDELIDTTWGTPVAISHDFSPGTYVQYDAADMEALVTPDCTTSCQPGDTCFIEFDAVAATITDTDPTNIHILGMTLGVTIDDLDGWD
jgi:hypothetical protein